MTLIWRNFLTSLAIVSRSEWRWWAVDGPLLWYLQLSISLHVPLMSISLWKDDHLQVVIMLSVTTCAARPKTCPHLKLLKWSNCNPNTSYARQLTWFTTVLYSRTIVPTLNSECHVKTASVIHRHYSMHSLLSCIISLNGLRVFSCQCNPKYLDSHCVPHNQIEHHVSQFIEFSQQIFIGYCSFEFITQRIVLLCFGSMAWPFLECASCYWQLATRLCWQPIRQICRSFLFGDCVYFKLLQFSFKVAFLHEYYSIYLNMNESVALNWYV